MVAFPSSCRKFFRLIFFLLIERRLMLYYCFIMQIPGLSKSIRVLADIEDPIGHVLKKTEVGKAG